MKFSVVVCTYMRPKDIISMLNSIAIQTIYPDEIIIVDASTDKLTVNLNLELKYKNLYYHYVDKNIRGSAKQRNYGIEKVDKSIEIICFLDDDVVLLEDYFEKIIDTYKTYPEALGVGGFEINNKKKWSNRGPNYKSSFSEYFFDGWVTDDGLRFKVRKLFGLDSNVPPAFMPNFSHGRSSLPPSGKIYEAEQIAGVVCSYRKSALNSQKFDEYFVGYSLYEDTALSLKIAKKGKLYINTNAKLNHYHSPSGRPNKYIYGKMVVQNGWYVWRVKNPNPKFKDWFKWHAITGLLIFIRATNIVTSSDRKEVLTETVGRIVGLISLIFNKPKKQ
jgi:GT2 family glycosyltransferase